MHAARVWRPASLRENESGLPLPAPRTIFIAFDKDPHLARREVGSTRQTFTYFILGSPGKTDYLTSMSTDHYRQRITIEPGKRGGKPCIRNMRITVYDILGWLAAGMSNAEILADFPELTAEDIQAALAFAADREHHLVAASA